tara:strand:+ start:290 stop:679 length:390 start_codon:yes stop_codon:yes gene_type:complete
MAANAITAGYFSMHSGRRLVMALQTSSAKVLNYLLTSRSPMRIMTSRAGHFPKAFQKTGGLAQAVASTINLKSVGTTLQRRIYKIKVDDVVLQRLPWLKGIDSTTPSPETRGGGGGFQMTLKADVHLPF